MTATTYNPHLGQDRDREASEIPPGFQQQPVLEAFKKLREERDNLRSALSHISRTAARSRTSTRRLRWIEARAEGALAGQPYSDLDIDLPRRASPQATERLSQRLAYARSEREELRKALTAIVCEYPDSPAANKARAALVAGTRHTADTTS